MAIVRLPQQYASDRFAEQVREASQSVGELVIAIKMYRPWMDDTNKDDPLPHCPRCWDSFYQESTDKDCPVCGGSGYSASENDHGIHQFGRIWAIVSDNRYSSPILRQRGQWNPDDRMIQYEGGIELQEHDYIVRVKKWSSDYRPLMMGDLFRLDNPYPTVSLRTGNEFGQLAGRNIMGYKAQAHLLREYQEKFDFPSDTPVPRFPIPQDPLSGPR